MDGRTVVTEKGSTAPYEHTGRTHTSTQVHAQAPHAHLHSRVTLSPRRLIPETQGCHGTGAESTRCSLALLLHSGHLPDLLSEGEGDRCCRGSCHEG